MQLLPRPSSVSVSVDSIVVKPVECMSGAADRATGTLSSRAMISACSDVVSGFRPGHPDHGNAVTLLPHDRLGVAGKILICAGCRSALSRHARHQAAMHRPRCT